MLAIAVLLGIVPCAAAAQDARTAVPDPPPPVELRPATVHFVADADGVAVHYLGDPVLEDTSSGGVAVRRVEPSRYTLLCEAPCSRELPQTHLGLAFSRGDVFLRDPDPLGVDGPAEVRIAWHDRSLERLAGILALSIGAPLGIALGVASTVVELGFGPPGIASAVGLSVGGAILIAAVVVGVYFVLSEDGADFRVTPLPDGGAAVFSEEWR